MSMSGPGCTEIHAKACLDSILCGEGSTHNAQKLLTEAFTVFAVGGFGINKSTMLKEIMKTTRIQTDFPFKTVHESQVARVLQPNGVYIAVSHGQPSYRLTYLQRPAT